MLAARWLKSPPRPSVTLRQNALFIAGGGLYSSGMAKRAQKAAKRKPGEPDRAPPAMRVVAEEETRPRLSPTVEESYGLEELTEPDDAGVSLEELGQTYAALMTQGADPYQDLRSPSEEAVAGEPDDEAPLGEEIPPQVLPGEDEQACDISPRSILEAILFVGHPANEPLTSKRIAGLMRGVRPGEIDDLIRELNEQYDAEGTPYRIESVGPGYQLMLRGEYAPLRDKFYGRVREARLSQSAIDVLAIVAYHQPIGLDEIDKLRGKPSGGILGQLVRRDLLSIERPAEKRAKPKYSTTSRFLDLFGMDSLSDLPRTPDSDRNL
jgi:segregation and condensation protein B